MQQPFGHREILARRCLELLAARHVVLKLGGRRARLGANGRSAGQQQRQESDAIEVRGFDQVTVPDAIGVARQLAPPQVHQKKREIVQDVCAGYLVVELDTVEESGCSIQQHDVAQMEVP